MEDYKKKIKLKGQTIFNDSSSFEEKQYGDIWTNDEYLQFMYERLIICKELLSDTGSIYLHCDWHKSAHSTSKTDNPTDAVSMSPYTCAPSANKPSVRTNNNVLS